MLVTIYCAAKTEDLSFDHHCSYFLLTTANDFALALFSPLIVHAAKSKYSYARLIFGIMDCIINRNSLATVVFVDVLKACVWWTFHAWSLSDHLQQTLSTPGDKLPSDKRPLALLFSILRLAPVQCWHRDTCVRVCCATLRQKNR